MTQALVTALGGKGKVIMTQGALGHTGAQGRAKGFNSIVKLNPGIEVLDTQPADWDVSKTARLWETYLTKYPQIDAAYFHNDDMALAAYNIMKAHNRTNILIGGCDAMPPALAGGRRRPHARHRAQPVLPHPRRRHPGGRRGGDERREDRRRASPRTSSPTARSSPRTTRPACSGWKPTS